MRDLMIDLETMGQRFDAPILSIGAVYFDLSTGNLGKTFISRVDPTDAMNYGKPHGETLKWWMGQGDAARKNAMSGTTSVYDAIAALCRFVDRDAVIWGNGPTFDVTILEHAMARTSVKVPWDFWNVNCCRTIKRIAYERGWKMPAREGVHHDALDDAVYQAKWVSDAWQHISGQTRRQVEDLC